MTTENQDEDLRLNEAADGSVIVGDAAPEPTDATPESGEDTRLAADDDSGEDEQGHAEETAEEAEARKKRNRDRRQQSKQNKKDYIESLKRELASRDRLLDEMNQRLAHVERRSTGSEMAQLEQAEKEAAQYYNHFKTVNAKAIEAADGATANDAMEKMFLAKQRMEQLAGVKKAMTSKQATPPPLDPRVQTLATEWMAKNKWYSPDGDDPDSSVMRAIDNDLAARGWNPVTPEYWQELENRKKKYLPHRNDSGYNVPQGAGKSSARVPVAGSGRDSSPGTSSGGYKLSADRVSALKEAGLWDDPKQRAQAIRNYQQYDKENAA